MKNIFVSLSLMFLLNGCAESVALLGTTAGGASSGKMVQTSLNSAISYGVKQQTGKSPFGHVLAYSDKRNSQKTKEPCISFVEKTNLKICEIVKKKITLTKAEIKNKKKSNQSIKEIASSLQPAIDNKSKVKYLD